MKQKVRLNLVTGDENLVTDKELYVAFNNKNEIVAVKQRAADGSLKSVVDTPVAVETKKTLTKSLAALKAGDKITVSPSTGKDAMKAVEITITA